MLKNYPAIRAFLSCIKRFQKAFWITGGLFAIADIVITLIPWLIGRLTVGLTSHNNHEIVFWTGALVLASAGHDMLWRAAELCYQRLLIAPAFSFDDMVLRKVLEHPYGYFVNNFTGKISSYATRLGQSFRDMLNDAQYNYINLIVAIPIITATMFTVNLYTGLIFIVALIGMFFIGRNLAIKAAGAERIEADKRSSIDGFAVDVIANFVSVKAFGSERQEAERLHHKRQTLIAATKYSFKRNMWFWGAMSVSVRWLIWPSTFILNVYLFMHGHLTLAQMTTFLAAIVLFSNFIWDMIWNISQLNIKIAGIEEAYSYLFGERNIFADEPHSDTAQPTRFKKSIELKDLHFAYPDKPDMAVLRGIDLTIRPGEKIGIVGPSGSGKSTLMKLLLGYYPVVAGQLFADGQPVASSDLTSLIAYVPQDTAIFHRTIRENIAYARPDANEEEILAAAQHAQADEFIRDLPEGYETLVGERGVKLSGGQRQRIAIARAILKDAPLLMLDEATSALDSESERYIQKALHELLEHRTALVIAHRLSTIQSMDRIIVMDKGAVVEQGTHKQLLAGNGIYAMLWAHQSGGFIEED
jgi:ATP-binding cassette subfamily B protein